MDLSQDHTSKKLSQQNYQHQGLVWFLDNVKKAKKVGVDRGMWALEAKIHLGPEQQKMHFKNRYFCLSNVCQSNQHCLKSSSGGPTREFKPWYYLLH